MSSSVSQSLLFGTPAVTQGVEKRAAWRGREAAAAAALPGGGVAIPAVTRVRYGAMRDAVRRIQTQLDWIERLASNA